MLIAWSKRRDFRRSLLPRYEVDIFRKFVGIGIPNLIDGGFCSHSNCFPWRWSFRPRSLDLYAQYAFGYSYNKARVSKQSPVVCWLLLRVYHVLSDSSRSTYPVGMRQYHLRWLAFNPPSRITCPARPYDHELRPLGTTSEWYILGLGSSSFSVYFTLVRTDSLSS